MSVDVEAIVIAHFLTDAGVTDLVDDRIRPELPPGDLELPCVTLGLLPGIFEDSETHWLERARLDVHSWGNTKAEARDVAFAVEASLNALPDAVHDGAVITSVRYDQTAWWNPDPETDTPRYVMLPAIYAHPTP